MNRKRSKVTYGQLDKALRTMGFTCHLLTDPPPARVYEHPQRPEAKITLPAFLMRDRVYEYHLLAVRFTLDMNGIADPTEFDKKLKKAG